MRARTPVLIALLASAYVAAQMLADISSLKITEVAGFSMDAGTLVYPFTFTLRDLVHKVAGKQVARALIIGAAADQPVHGGPVLGRRQTAVGGGGRPPDRGLRSCPGPGVADRLCFDRRRGRRRVDRHRGVLPVGTAVR